MAIQWSASSGYMSVGVEMWYTGDPVSGQVEVHAQFWLRSDGYGHQFTARTDWWGNVGTGSEQVSFSSPTGATVYKDMGTSHWTENLLPNQGRSVGVGYSLGPIWNGGHPSVQAWLDLPARPARPPKAPAWCRARLLADGARVEVTWPKAAPADASSPVRSYVVERWDAYSDSSSGPWNPREWHAVAWINADGNNASEFSVIDSWSLYQDDRFWYRVSASPITPPTWIRAASDFLPGPPSPTSGGVSTRPKPATALRATKDAQGRIRITWRVSFPYPSDATVEIYDGDDKVGAVRADADGWTHDQADPQVPHTYYAYVKTDALESERSAASNTIQVLQKPGVPGIQAPGQYAAAGATTVTWAHNSLDDTWQEAAEIRWRLWNLVETTAWTTVTVTGPAQTRVLDLPTGDIEFQVRTKGAYKEYSDWTTARRTLVTNPPVVSLAPEDTTITQSAFAGTIVVTHPTGSAPTTARVEASLLDQAGAVIEQIKGPAPVLGAAPDFTRANLRFRARLENKRAYTVRVAITDGYGLTTTLSRTYTIEYPTPPAPIVTTTWDDAEGHQIVSIASPAVPAGGKTPPAVETRLERSIDGGTTWETVADHLPPSTMLTDREALSAGTTTYRCTATSALPSSITTTVEALADSESIWINAGAGFGRALRLAWDPRTGMSVGLVNREVKYFAGRAAGVEMSGTQRQRVVSVSATLLDASVRERAAVEELAYMPAPFMYRDPMGRKLYGSLSDVSLDREIGGVWKMTARLTEVGRG